MCQWFKAFLSYRSREADPNPVKDAIRSTIIISHCVKLTWGNVVRYFGASLWNSVPSVNIYPNVIVCVYWFWYLCTVECRYNAVQFIRIIPMSLSWQQQNLNQISNSRTSYGVSVVRVLKKIDRVITALHCTYVYTMRCRYDVVSFILNIHKTIP